MKSQEFSIWNCIYHQSGLANAHCNLNGTPQLDHCKGECEHWINHKGENHEQILERLCNELKGSMNLGEGYWYDNPVTGENEYRYKGECYPDETKCKLCKHGFERKEE